MYIPFEEMPSTSRIWIYQSDRAFSEEEKNWITTKLKAFCDGWNTHGNLMKTSFEMLLDQVLVLAVDESTQGASGCSIDSSVAVLRQIERELRVSLLDAGKIGLVDSGRVVVNPISAIKPAVNSGQITPDSQVINPMVQKKADLERNWIVSAKDSWLKRYFQ